MIWDVIVLGAGAAGMMCAPSRRGRRGRKVLVIDHARKSGREDPHLGRRAGAISPTKSIAPERFLSQNPRFALSALKQVHPVGFHRPRGCCRDRLA
jgi:predicted flavoprotein YhiN